MGNYAGASMCPAVSGDPRRRNLRHKAISAHSTESRTSNLIQYNECQLMFGYAIKSPNSRCIPSTWRRFDEIASRNRPGTWLRVMIRRPVHNVVVPRVELEH